MVGKVVKVKIAEYHVLKGEGILMTIGLGSCVGIALYDAKAKVAGLAHILLPDSQQFVKRDNLGKYADTAIPLLIQEMKKLGADIRSIQSKIAGGSALFQSQNNHINGIGIRNVEAVKTALQELELPLVGSDTGGSAGRTMQLFSKDGKVLVKAVGSGPIKI